MLCCSAAVSILSLLLARLVCVAQLVEEQKKRLRPEDSSEADKVALNAALHGLCEPSAYLANSNTPQGTEAGRAASALDKLVQRLEDQHGVSAAAACQ